MLHDVRSIDAGLAWHGFRLPGRWLFVNNETTLSLCPLWSISNRVSHLQPPPCFRFQGTRKNPPDLSLWKDFKGGAKIPLNSFHQGEP
jgi:hypothetical protein